jgi:hypothetical protein
VHYALLVVSLLLWLCVFVLMTMLMTSPVACAF